MPGKKWFQPLELTPRERADFLRSERWGVFGTLMDSGAPVGVPLPFVVDGDDFDEKTAIYLAVHNDDPFVARVRAGTGICMAVHNRQFPTKAVIASGQATVVEDPDPEVVRRLQQANWTRPEDPAAEAGVRWTAAHQAIVEMRFDEIVSWDSKKTPGYASAPAVHADSIQRNGNA